MANGESYVCERHICINGHHQLNASWSNSSCLCIASRAQMLKKSAWVLHLRHTILVRLYPPGRSHGCCLVRGAVHRGISNR